MGFDQNIWGDSLWTALHCVTFDYPINPSPEDKKNMYNFFSSLQTILPCVYCRDNYKRNLNEFPMQLDSRKNLSMWLMDLHNEVNGQTGKRHYTYEEILKSYEKKLGKKIKLTEDDRSMDLICRRHRWNNVTILMVLIVVVLMVYLYRLFRK